MGAARIGKITMKNGGAEVRVLHQATPNPDNQNYRGTLMKHARSISEMGTPGSDLVGFVIIGLFSDGTTATGYRWEQSRTPIPRPLMPAYLAEIVRRDIIAEPEAERVAVHVFNHQGVE